MRTRKMQTFPNDWDETAGKPPDPKLGVEHLMRWAKKRAFNVEEEKRKEAHTPKGPQFWFGPLDGTPVVMDLKDRLEVPLWGGRVAVYDREQWTDGEGRTVVGYVFQREYQDSGRY